MRAFIKYSIVTAFMLLGITAKSQISIGIVNSWGTNTIDFESLMGSPYWSDDNSPYDTQITDYSRFVYKGGVQLTKTLKGGDVIGIEVGISRLYYVEERYSVFLYDNEFRWRTYDIWTTNISAIGQMYFGNNFYLHGGAGLCLFHLDSGISPSIHAGIGYNIKLNNKISIPIEFRNDWIFGEETSGVFALAAIFKINVSKKM